LQIDGVFRYVSPGLQLFFPIFRGTTLNRVTTGKLNEFLVKRLAPMVKATSSRTNFDWDTNSQSVDIQQYLPSS